MKITPTLNTILTPKLNHIILYKCPELFKNTMFMDCVNSLQHIFPIALSFQWIHLFFLFKPAIEINISTLHYHVDMLISDFTKNKTCMLKVKEISFYREILIK